MANARLPRLIALSLSVLVLVACNPASEPAPDTALAESSSAEGTPKATKNVTRWSCGVTEIATYFDDASLESITLQTPQRTLTLKSMANDDGARFADAAGNEFWSRPGDVRLTLVGEHVVPCAKQRG